MEVEGEVQMKPQSLNRTTRFERKAKWERVYGFCEEGSEINNKGGDEGIWKERR